MVLRVVCLRVFSPSPLRREWIIPHFFPRSGGGPAVCVCVCIPALPSGQYSDEEVSSSVCAAARLTLAFPVSLDTVLYLFYYFFRACVVFFRFLEKLNFLKAGHLWNGV